ncbi:hypothetical protein I7I48_00175 [Histoplasma ohiense]|nr:hypothetical protein I7I48_00175 [Histoplasma ohiense (nom. inval.)]
MEKCIHSIPITAIGSSSTFEYLPQQKGSRSLGQVQTPLTLLISAAVATAVMMAPVMLLALSVRMVDVTSLLLLASYCVGVERYGAQC